MSRIAPTSANANRLTGLPNTYIGSADTGPLLTEAPGLTVVVLTYNSADTIGNCLDALVKQEFTDFHVVIVDDDSSDETLAVVGRYADVLSVSVIRNGSHNIPRGRNIAIDAARTGLVAFIDSDDCAEPGWTQAIVMATQEHPGAALIGGPLLPAHRTSTAHAISLNDEAVCRIFWGDAMKICAGNCAINRALAPEIRFDERFRAAEDLELAARVRARYQICYAPGMQIRHYSRETFRAYARQMYRYGYMKMIFSFYCRSFQWPDFVPVALLAGGAAFGIATHSWWPVLLNLPLAVAEAVFVVLYERCPPRIAALTLPAWLVKNLAWSYGLTRGLIALATARDWQGMRARPPRRV